MAKGFSKAEISIRDLAEMTMLGATDAQIGAYVREKLMAAGCKPIAVDGKFFKTKREAMSYYKGKLRSQ